LASASPSHQDSTTITYYKTSTNENDRLRKGEALICDVFVFYDTMSVFPFCFFPPPFFSYPLVSSEKPPVALEATASSKAKLLISTFDTKREKPRVNSIGGMLTSLVEFLDEQVTTFFFFFCAHFLESQAAVEPKPDQTVFSVAFSWSFSWFLTR
jgi:hypothetical protein